MSDPPHHSHSPPPLHRPSNAQQPVTSTSGSAADLHARGHVAHHIAEFGHVDNIVHLADDKRDSDTLPAPHLSRKDKISCRERWSRLGRRLMQKRHLMQYFHQETLYRTEGLRSIGPDELFLDLVIVGGIAALGHELRETFQGWPDLEKFLLLFFAIYSGWSSLVLLWNMWGVRSDLVDKLGIYLVFLSLTGIALGAHGAFVDGPRPYVAVSAFAATALPAAQNLVWNWTEPLLKNPQNIINQISLTSWVRLISVVPYLVAAFVKTERTTRNLFWAPTAIQVVSIFFTGSFYRLLHRNRSGYSRMAIAIELMVEKYEVLTMIVLGESVLGLLFEAALVITADGVRIGHVYATAAAGTAMLYALQTLYANVDGRIVKGGVHAIRHKGLFGIMWGQLHMVYHIALILFATGFGISVRDIAIPPSTAVEGAVEKLINVVVRAEKPGKEAAGLARFNRPERWLFSGGWGASIILSGLIGSLHLAGPRVATKWFRLALRALLAIGVMVGMPFSDTSAGTFVLVHTVVLVFIAVTEFVLHQMDGMGFFRSELTTATNSSGMKDSEDMLGEDEMGNSNGVNEEMTKVCPAVAGPKIARELQSRLRKRHSNTLVPVRTSAAAEMGDGDQSESART